MTRFITVTEEGKEVDLATKSICAITADSNGRATIYLDGKGQIFYAQESREKVKELIADAESGMDYYQQLSAREAEGIQRGIYEACQTMRQWASDQNLTEQQSERLETYLDSLEANA